MTAPTTVKIDPPLAAGEVQTLRAFLDYYRATIRRQAEGLTKDQLALALPPATMTLGGMLKHLAVVEQGWLLETFCDEPLTEPFASVDWRADRDWDWHSAADDEPEYLFELYDRSIALADARIEAALGGDGLDTLSARADGSGEGRFSLRWILVHLIEEYARHAGHADLIRESIDGATDL